jgi:5-methylcytosine-specific restriction endonuclease McrA
MHEHHLLLAASKLTTDALLDKIKAIALTERGATVELVAHVAELLGRKTELGDGGSGVSEYLRAHLHLSEDAAYNRVAAARAVRRFPVILDHLAAGWVNVTIVKVLAPVLTAENHVALLTEARHRRRRDVEIIVARIAPQPERPGTVRRLPRPAPLPAAAPARPLTAEDPAPHTAAPPATTAPGEDPTPFANSVGTVDEAPAVRPAPYRQPVKAIAPSRFRLDVTVGQDAHDALRFLQDMLAREIPGGDVSKIVEHSILATAREVRKKKMRETDRPRAARPRKEGSRRASAAAERAVWKRDGHRCTFVGRFGRCTQTKYLEIHHIHPYALDGPPTLENLTLRCRAHNAYASEQDFGERGNPANYRKRGKHAVSGQFTPSQDGGAHAARPTTGG